ncbi:MAG: alpha-2-macroglobulin family protein [Candidatus Gracilibacteria bacterium]|nr:alpha-2-macroglobulin family protein [Candidatus Gracilibacteria bacterium]
MKNFNLKKKHLMWIIYILFSIIVFVLGFFGVKSYLDYRAEKLVSEINIVLDDANINRDNCSIILGFDKTGFMDNEFFNENKFESMKKKCDELYNISYIELNEDNCKNLIKENKIFFSKDYIILDDFNKKRELCTSKYLKVKFSTGALFDVENDFKSEVKMDFSLEFFTEVGDENSEEYLKNRIEVKNRLKNLLVIEPKVDFSIDDIYLTPNKAILRLPLVPLTKYTISLKNYDTSLGEKTRNDKFVFTTPDNKYFGIKLLDKVSLYQNNKLPKFQVLQYNSAKTKTKIKACRIPTETYAKIEVYRKKAEKMDVKDFFLKEIDKLKNFECSEKDLALNSPLTPPSNQGGEKQVILTKKDFTLKDIIGENVKTGLYFVQFSEEADRQFNGKLSYPTFFGIIDSHIIMKVSKNGEAFFFVNDFGGKPLANQKLTVLVNDFKEQQKVWNNDKGDFDINYLTVLDKNVFGEQVELGTTNTGGILKVDLKQKVSDAFMRTYSEDWEYDWEGLYKTFFVISSGANNLSYVNSTWNSGIAPWNFGYTVPTGYWEQDKNLDQDAIQLDKYSIAEPEYYSHIYTDRMLYLPGETVNIKGVLRNSKDLSIPNGKIANLKVTDGLGKEIVNKEVKVSEYGSISDSLNIPIASTLGFYSIGIYVDGNIIGWGGYNVEVFKNPKFKNEVVLSTEGLNEGLVTIEKEEVKNHDYWIETIYSGKFKIKGKVISKYYNGASLAKANFNYKIYKQYYYDESYFNDCYYGCYWEPEKEFYSEGKGVLDGNGIGSFEVNVDFSSNYSDYKYIAEVTVTDSVGDTISGANSIIAKLPSDYKMYDNTSSVEFSAENKFILAGNSLDIKGGLTQGKWTTGYNDKYVLVIKKKNYKTLKVNDVKGYSRPVTSVSEKIEKVMLVNDKNLKPTLDGKLRLNYNLKEVGEYVFEYGKIDINKNIDIAKVIEDFNKDKKSERLVKVNNKVEVCERPITDLLLKNNINSTLIDCKTIIRPSDEIIKLSDLYSTKKYFNVLTYGDTDGSNPVDDDNKVKVIPEKISYRLGEKARVLVRLPFSKGKILWTVEKQGVIKSEYIDVKSNVFFKEIDVDDTFVPNAYIGVVAIDTRLPQGKPLQSDEKCRDAPCGYPEIKVPEYKVGYSEIVVDKTDKKTYVTISKDKKTYKPRDKVNLDLSVADINKKGKKSELTVMVVDDSLISLMGNVDLNTLEKFYKKLPFQIQTSITNIAMLRNYYFSRPGIVGGSGFGNFKGGDSAVSTRNIFKNTAYYNPSVITDDNGKAKVSFDLPDNLTNFRVMVVSNSKDNMFGYADSQLEVRKNVIIEDKTPLILIDGDISSIGANIFNNTDKDIGFKLELTANINVKDAVKNLIIPAGKSVNTIWEVLANNNQEKITYKISALGDSIDNSDIIENTIDIKQTPELISNIIKNQTLEAGNTVEIPIKIPENTSLDKSKVVVTVSNNKLVGIEKIVSSLASYPYGCIEQTTSATLPNAILKKFDNLLSGIISDKNTIDTNINYGLERIKSMQTIDGGFAYWEGVSASDLHVTPYVVRSLIDMRDAGVKLPEGVLEKAIKYLEDNSQRTDIGDLEKAEIYWTLAKAGKITQVNINLKTADRHTLLAYTYGLVINTKGQANKIVDQNIEILKQQVDKTDEYNWYWDDMSDKSIFTSLLMDYNYSREYIDTLIGQLYDYDWSSYYYSTQSKNNAFMAFAKYVAKYGKESNSKFSYTLGKYVSNKNLEVGKIKSNVYKQTFKLSDVLVNKTDLLFKLTNYGGDRLYTDITIEVFPEDKTKIRTYSNGLTVKREIYEVIDENDIADKCDWVNDQYVCVKPKGFKLVDGNEYKVGVLYKSKIIVDFKDTKNRTNLVIEDYLAGSFRVINSKFNTEQISIRQNQTDWTWNHTEFKPNVVMANATYVWSGNSSFEYFFRPEFGGKFTHPPVVAYFMYNPKIRANTEFKTISVK